MVVVDLEVLNLLDLSVRPPDGQSLDQCCRPEANVLFDGAAAHESAGWEDVADELVGVGIDNELAANSAAVAGVSHERHDSAPETRSSVSFFVCLSVGRSVGQSFTHEFNF